MKTMRSFARHKDETTSQHVTSSDSYIIDLRSNMLRLLSVLGD